MKLFSKNFILDLSRIHIMGILNVTPDSFSEDGINYSFNKAMNYVDVMIKHGASIIDIGGESTRPGAKEVSVEEEMSRVIPIVEAVSKRFKIWISVNTSQPEVMYEANRAGAHLINDIRSLKEPGAIEVAAETKLAVCLMHMQNQPSNMQDLPKYDDVFYNVHCFFTEHIERCESAGILKERLLLDPGFGFGKYLIHNYTLLARLSELNCFGLPLLVGMSRKSMIGQLLNVGLKERLHGSLSCAVIAAMQGARVIRVHDVKETVEAIRIVEATLSSRKQKYYE